MILGKSGSILELILIIISIQFPIYVSRKTYTENLESGLWTGIGIDPINQLLIHGLIGLKADQY